MHWTTRFTKPTGLSTAKMIGYLAIPLILLGVCTRSGDMAVPLGITQMEIILCLLSLIPAIVYWWSHCSRTIYEKRSGGILLQHDLRPGLYRIVGCTEFESEIRHAIAVKLQPLRLVWYSDISDRYDGVKPVGSPADYLLVDSDENPLSSLELDAVVLVRHRVVHTKVMDRIVVDKIRTTVEPVRDYCILS